MAQATLYDPQSNARKAITIGSPEEKQLFSQGWKLETKPPGRTLEGTLPSIEEVKRPSTLPQTTSSLTDFTAAMKEMSRIAYANKPSTSDILNRYNEAGVPVSNPSLIQSALASDTEQRAGRIMDVYQNTVNLIKEQEAKRQKMQEDNLAFGRDIMLTVLKNPELFAGTTGEEYEQLKQGVIPDEMINRMAQVAQTTPVPSINEQLKAEEAGYSIYNGQLVPSTKTGGSVSWRNNNPLNIKFGDFAQQYGASPGTQATDGGVFANFPSVEAGLEAAKALLTGSSYRNLPLDQAMRRWSGNGYGQEVTSRNLWGKTTGQMSPQELDSLIQDMQRREGWVEGEAQESTVDIDAQAKQYIEGTKSRTDLETQFKDDKIVAKIMDRADELRQAGEGTKGGYEEARQFISDNPNASRAELKSSILEYTDLDNTEIEALLDTVEFQAEQFLDEQFFRDTFGEDELKKAAKKDFGSIWKESDKEVKEYLDSLMKKVDAWRKAGYSDEEIFKMMS